MDNRSKEVVESFLLQVQKRDFDTQREMVFEFHRQLDEYYQCCEYCGGDDIEHLIQLRRAVKLAIQQAETAPLSMAYIA